MVTALKTIRPDTLFRAFADPTRLRILNLLRLGEICVCDLMVALQLPQAKTSRHLAYLRKAGLVRTRRDGQWMHYSLAEPASKVHGKLLDCLNDCQQEMVELQRDLRRLNRKGKGCC